ncbi:MAG: M20/M25/M40 family metallo-hydrolase [Planctomycetota bacterium]|nr:M20/M25/M40 family metallo-hydrolase [Planctomycetota bacterium]
MLELLRILVDEHGVSGYEHDIREKIISLLPPKTPYLVDNLGNLLVTVGSRKRNREEKRKNLLFLAHMDELGFVVSEIRNDGFLKIKSLGGIDSRIMPSRILKIKTDKGIVKGIVGIKPPHLMGDDRAKEMREVIPIEDLYIDIGASSAEEVESFGVSILSPVTFDKSFEVLNGKYIVSRALDDRAGCAVMLKAIEILSKEKLKGTVCFAFTVQEERGLRGAELVGKTVSADYAFAIDTASCGDIPQVRRDYAPAVLGKGPALRALDNRHISDEQFVREICEIAKKNHIPTQLIFTGGSTDAAAVETSGPKSLPICFPVRYTHSTVEMVSIEDIENTLNLVLAISRHYQR